MRRRGTEAGDLPDVLQRRRLDVGHRDLLGVRLTQGLDAAAHGFLLVRVLDGAGCWTGPGTARALRVAPARPIGAAAHTLPSTRARRWCRATGRGRVDPDPAPARSHPTRAERRLTATLGGRGRGAHAGVEDLQGRDVRLPDERARLRADLRAAGAGRLRARRPTPTTADVVVFNTCAVRENADNRLYGNLGHLRPVKDKHPGMQIAVGGCLAQKDRGEIVKQGALGRRGLRHPQHRLAAGAAGAGPAQRRRRGRDPRVARGLPVDAADPARVDLRRLGVDLGRLQQHLHVLHRAGAARQGEGPPARRHPGRGRGAGRRGRAGGDPARAERQLLRRRVRRPARLRQAAARLRRRSTGWSGCASPARTRRTSPTT